MDMKLISVIIIIIKMKIVIKNEVCIKKKIFKIIFF